MPFYTFRDKRDEQITERFLKMAELETFLQENVNLEQVHLSAPALGDSVRLGIRKTDSSFRDLLKTIKKRNHGSTIDER